MMRFGRWRRSYYALALVLACLAIWLGLPTLRHTYLGSFIYGDCSLAAKEGDAGCREPGPGGGELPGPFFRFSR